MGRRSGRSGGWRFAAALAALLAAPARAQDGDDPLRWLHGQPLTFFDLGILRLERDVHLALPWLAESEPAAAQAVAGVQYQFWRRRVVVYVSLYRPRSERTEGRCVALFRRLVERMTANAPEGAGRTAWYLEKTFVPTGRERLAPGSFGRRLGEVVHAEVTLRGRHDDARAGETGRMTCSGRFDAGDSEIERVFVN
jgi:hypothetical protein